MRDHIGALLNVRENRLFVGVLNFQHDSSKQSCTGPFDFRVPDLGAPIVWCVCMGNPRCVTPDVRSVHDEGAFIRPALY